MLSSWPHEKCYQWCWDRKAGRASGIQSGALLNRWHLNHNSSTYPTFVIWMHNSLFIFQFRNKASAAKVLRVLFNKNLFSPQKWKIIFSFSKAWFSHCVMTRCIFNVNKATTITLFRSWTYLGSKVLIWLNVWGVWPVKATYGKNNVSSWLLHLI